MNKIRQVHFIVGPDKEADMVASVKATQEFHNEYSDVFTGIGCFKDTFSLQIKEGINYKIFQVTTNNNTTMIGQNS